jgi:hypothetical protein
VKQHPKVHIFWDNSNVFVPAQYVASRRDGLYAAPRLRIHFDNLLRLAHAGRHVASAVCVGSGQATTSRVMQRLRTLGVSVRLYERGQYSRREQGVDECLQVHMLRTATDISVPGVAVLLTGDGAGYEDGSGYHADLARLHRLGWGVEVLSWSGACNLALREWATVAGVFIELDHYFESVTFIEGGRTSTPLSLVRRRLAVPAERTAA